MSNDQMPIPDSESPRRDPQEAAATDMDDAIPDTESVQTETPSDPQQWKAELEQCNDRLLRTQAELENYRKRVRREMDDERRYAMLPLLRDLLHVVDNLQRALQSAEERDNAAGLLEGVELVSTQLASVLENHHCEQIEAEGASFDPNFHEAISQQPSPDLPVGTVTHVAQTGYRLHERVVRPAQVIVSTRPDVDAEDAGEDES